MMRVKNLYFSYYQKPLLKNISFQVEQGEFLGILGPNGSGKSTLMKNMLKNLDYDSGEICVLGRDLKGFSLKEFARISGYLPQISQLKTPLKVLDVLLMSKYPGLKYGFNDYSQKDKDEAVNIARSLKFENFLERNVLSLSGGEFQRVLLARAILKNPKILFLDEPTSALDLNYAIELLNLCESLIKERNIAVVAILHDLNLASMFCSRILFIKDGKIRYDGKVNELFTTEILKEIYNLNCKVLMQENKPYILALK
ncbi:MAG: ABC transporter ATP-binding protein [Helicobacter sp.]|nr:ABC transporter ATP-binding protein [Helicobacter sp.]